MRAWLGNGLDQLVDDVLRRRHIGIAHAEIDDVGTTRARCRFEQVDFGKNVWRQALDAVKLFGQFRLLSMLS